GVERAAGVGGGGRGRGGEMFLSGFDVVHGVLARRAPGVGDGVGEGAGLADRGVLGRRRRDGGEVVRARDVDDDGVRGGAVERRQSGSGAGGEAGERAVGGGAGEGGGAGARGGAELERPVDEGHVRRGA